MVKNQAAAENDEGEHQRRQKEYQQRRTLLKCNGFTFII